jgi:2-polyprenyl-6-methoxyphenol hydroxylase-like FAD-dependent oxidoreductase
MATTAPILVVGACTTGLTMACELARHGAPVRIIEKQDRINPHSRANGLHGRTLEIFDDLGIVDEILAQGDRLLGVSQYANGKRFMHSNSGDVDSPYPFVVTLEQFRTEATLERLLNSLGVNVERGSELLTFSEQPEMVTATVRRADGTQEAVETPWLVGCDGAHSRVRHLKRMHFPGEEDPHQYVVSDVRMETTLAHDELHLFVSDAGSLLIAPLPSGYWLTSCEISTMHDAAREQPSLQEVQAIVNERGPGNIRISDPRWLAYYRINYREARHYRHGRVFLAGDAVHIHSPIGGLGMNTGIQDAYNLAWKLALVWRGRAPQSLLDSYEKERRPVGEDVLKTTKMMTERLQAFSNLSDEQRKQLYFNAIVPPEVAKSMARHQEQLDLNYSKSPICHQHQGSHFGKTHFATGPRPGEEALDAGPLTHDNVRTTLFKLLRGPRHTLLLFPGAYHEANSWRRLTDLAKSLGSVRDLLDVYFVAVEPGAAPSNANGSGSVIFDPERSLHYRYGAETECLYLIRPDGYVGYRSEPATTSTLQAYLKSIFVS